MTDVLHAGAGWSGSPALRFHGCTTEQACASRPIVTHELISQQRLSDETYAEAPKQWGEPTVAELLALVGYFAMVCWLMNVARAPGPET